MQGIDLVKDDVEKALEREVENIRALQERMREKLDIAASQLDQNLRKQVQTQEDLDNKVTEKTHRFQVFIDSFRRTLLWISTRYASSCGTTPRTSHCSPAWRRWTRVGRSQSRGGGLA